ncbi:MAG TPA: IclR family transcriptional regulator [Sulfitobacter sp.]|jgi:IclR family mhp operon transcriptional activator|uniref:IclR family transcriptional regulator domain-containing protein n=1 Tax=Sulfitobacter dubius TaxID=218673 RepID=UPI000E948613|nr:IclR family transcriptional regulator [Sulfitobacter sp.]
MAYKPVTASLRVLDVLVAVNRASGTASVGEVHRQTGLDKATIVRMLETLSHAGYITRETEGGSWRVTGRTLLLSCGFNRLNEIGAVVSADLNRFRHSIGWPSDVAILDEDAMIVAETSRAAEPMRFSRPSGFRAPVLLTSLGRAYLANCPGELRERFLAAARTNPAPEFNLARDPAALDAALEKIRAQGYATMEDSYSSENYDSQFFSIGVSLGTRSHTFGAMNIIYLRQAMTPEEARDRMLAPLQDIAATLAEKLSQQAGLVG